MENLVFQHYRDTNRFNQDYSALAEFFIQNSGSGLNENWHLGRLEWSVGHPMLDEKTLPLMGFWEKNGKIVAVVLHDTCISPVYILCDENHGDLKPEMLEYAMKAYKYDGALSIIVHEDDAAFQSLLMDNGFKKEEWGESLSELSCENSKRYPFRLPDGFSLTTLSETPDANRYRWVIHKGFDHAGQPDNLGQPMPAMSPYNGINLRMFASAPDGEFASHCGIWYGEGMDTAYIEPVVTIPEYRKMGLAKAAIYEAVNRCAAMGARRAVVISGLDFYYKIGFTQSSMYYAWSKKNLEK